MYVLESSGFGISSLSLSGDVGLSFEIDAGLLAVLSVVQPGAYFQICYEE